MRDIFTEIFENQPVDPMESARRGARPTLRKRFYERAHVGGDGGAGFAVLLDGKPVKTPARRALAAPTQDLAEHLAQEWNAQQQVIDPGAHAAHAARQCGDRRGGGASATGGRGGGEISRLRFAVLSRRGAARPGRAAGAALGSGAGLGASSARRALRPGRGRDLCRAAERGDRRRALGDPCRSLAIGRGGLDHDADRLRPAGARAGAWATRLWTRPGPPPMSTRTGRCSIGGATRSRSPAAPIGLARCRRRRRCCNTRGKLRGGRFGRRCLERGGFLVVDARLLATSQRLKRAGAAAMRLRKIGVQRNRPVVAFDSVRQAA